MTINDGSHGKTIRQLQLAINRRLSTRSATKRMIRIDDVFGPKTRRAMVYAAYLLGADMSFVNGLRNGPITEDEQNFVRFPGRRNQSTIILGKRRVAAHRKVLAKQKEEAEVVKGKRNRIVQLAEQAADNYRNNPGAYHYFAGGIPNLQFLEPTPKEFRSDCSQFVASVYKAAEIESPASPLAHLWVSTFSIAKSPHAKVVSRRMRKPGDLGMYGSLIAPHHVELWCVNKYIGHGSPPIDSLTPGEPDYYITFDFLN